MALTLEEIHSLIKQVAQKRYGYGAFGPNPLFLSSETEQIFDQAFFDVLGPILNEKD